MPLAYLGFQVSQEHLMILPLRPLWHFPRLEPRPEILPPFRVPTAPAPAPGKPCPPPVVPPVGPEPDCIACFEEDWRRDCWYPSVLDRGDTFRSPAKTFYANRLAYLIPVRGTPFSRPVTVTAPIEAPTPSADSHPEPRFRGTSFESAVNFANLSAIAAAFYAISTLPPQQVRVYQERQVEPMAPVHRVDHVA